MPAQKQPEPIVISDWDKGIASSPYTGFQDMKNCDPYTIPGVIRIGYRSDDTVSTAVTDTVKWIVKNSTGNLYALGDTGRVYTNTGVSGNWTLISGNTTNADSPSGQGLAVWKDYLFVARSTKIDVYGPLSNSPSWTNDWQTIQTDAHWHPMLAAQDDILYVGAGKYLASIAEATGTFAPGSSSTYTFTAQALDLPAQYRIKCLAELGKNLYIGTIVGSSLWGGDNVADIFPWHRTSSSFELPVRLNDSGVHQMITLNNILYAVTGFRPSVYITNGVSARLLVTIPESFMALTGGSFVNLYPGAIMALNNRVYFGVSRGTASSSIDGIGVYSVTPQGKLLFETSSANNTTVATNANIIGALFPAALDTYALSMKDNTETQMNYVGGSNRHTSYRAFFLTSNYYVGTKNNKRTFPEIEIVFDRPLSSGQGIKIYYRTSLAASFTLMGTYDFDTYGAVQTINTGSPLVDIEQVQFKVELTGNASTTPHLRQIIFR